MNPNESRTRSTPTEFESELDVFWGATSPSMATIYVRLSSKSFLTTPAKQEFPNGPAQNSQRQDGFQLSGYVRGPHCRYGRTLPVTAPLRDLGPGESLLAEARLPDPCPWTGQLPALYDVHVELRDGDQLLQSTSRPLGIRRLGASGKSLYWEGRRWVPRGVHLAETPPVDAVVPFRNASLAAFVEGPAAAFLEEASRDGVPVAAILPASGGGYIQRLRQLARWPAVFMAVLPSEALPNEAAFGLRRAVPNLLLAASLGARQLPAIPAWAQLAYLEFDQSADWNQVAGSPFPVIVWRGADWGGDPAQARRACDQLQRDLASCGCDVAGYVGRQRGEATSFSSSKFCKRR